MDMYSAEFYDLIRPGIVSSASQVVPVVADLVQPATMIDVGCGEGWWARAFADLGVRATAVDGPHVDARAAIPITRLDLATARLDLGRFDLAVCLEVAEHLPPSRAETLVDDLIAAAPVVLFSAAIPGQGGAGHVNELPLPYWVALFQARGHAVSGALRWLFWDDPKVEHWYAQNMIVTAQDPGLYPAVFDTPLANPYMVVHPIMFDARRSQ